MGISVDGVKKAALDVLKAGTWIAISANKDDEDEHTPSPFEGSYMFGGGRRPAKLVYPVNGKPLRIIAVSIPFLAVTDCRTQYTLDLRECEVILLQKNYVKKMTNFDSENVKENAHVFMVRNQEKPKKKKGDTKGLCPACGDRMVQRLKSEGVWIARCNTCGFEGGRGEKA